MNDYEHPEDHQAYFDAQRVDNLKHWRRLGGMPSFAGQDVLDFGCGHGAMALQAIEAGANSVLGIELSKPRVSYANRAVKPIVPARLDFQVIDVRDLPGENRFDAILSKDTFEHVSDVEDTLAALTRLARPGGRLYLGFSPLYNSPFGDHGELGSSVPWAHLIAGEKSVLAALNARSGTTYASLPDAGYNMRPPCDFFAAFDALPLIIRRLTINPAEPGLKALGMAGFNVLRRIPGLAPYFTVGIYVVLEKTVHSQA